MPFTTRVPPTPQKQMDGVFHDTDTSSMLWSECLFTTGTFKEKGDLGLYSNTWQDPWCFVARSLCLCFYNLSVSNSWLQRPCADAWFRGETKQCCRQPIVRRLYWVVFDSNHIRLDVRIYSKHTWLFISLLNSYLVMSLLILEILCWLQCTHWWIRSLDW